MNFLAPIFLAGALAVSLPLVFHLIRRTTRERTFFSSLMFLNPAPPRLTRRSRLENLLLLLLRCAAICLLTLGFARPFIKRPLPESPATAASRRIIVVVDCSASMRRADLWSQARTRVDSILRGTTAADRAAVFTFDRQLHPVVTFEEWNSASDRRALVTARLAGLKPGWSATGLDQAIIHASEMLADADTNSTGGGGQIVVVSDFQSGSRLGALQGQDWPKEVEVVNERVVAKTSNASLQLLPENSPSTDANALRLRVSNAADSQREQLQVGWAKDERNILGKAVAVYVPAGQSRVVSLPRLEGQGETDRILLRGDDEDFDNTVYSVVPRAVRVPVYFFGGGSAADSQTPLYFISRAFQSTPQQQVDVVAKPPSSILTSREAQSAALFIISDAVLPETASVLRQQMQQGKTVICAPVSAGAAGSLGLLLGGERILAEDTAPRNYAMLGEINFQHPLFAPFADARYSDFTKIHFWKYRRLEPDRIPDARTIAKFDSGDPAVLEVPVGRGRLIIFASGWSPADSQLPLSTKFVPLLYSALDLGGAVPQGGTQFNVDDAIPLALGNDVAAGRLTVTRPDGISTGLAAGTTNFTEALVPGIYLVSGGTSTRQFAVNLDANEGRTAPLPLDELDRLGVPGIKTSPVSEDALRTRQQLKNTALESRQKLWRWFVIATLAVLLLETAIAGWAARKTAIQTEAAA